jgi:pseudo-rSAM protein
LIISHIVACDIQIPPKFNILITLDLKKSQLLLEHIAAISENKLGQNTAFEFVLESESEFNFLSDEILNKYPKLNYHIKPFYTGNNYNFFKENIFYSESDIIESIGTMRETLSKTKINYIHFGQLNVLPDGQILTNTNSRSIGNIYTNNLDEAIYNAHFDESTTWFFKRSDIAPCKECLYCDLCPSIGNYEFAFDKFNLCNL